MSFFGSMGAGPGYSGAAFGRTASRTDILGRNQNYAPFANPFFDQASTYLPPSVKSLFGFCRYYHLTHGIINAINTKAAEYPITDLVISHEQPEVVRAWEELFDDNLNYRVHQLEANLDYCVYGNSFVSPSFPFTKKLACGACNAEINAIDHKEKWRYTNSRFWLQCPKCGQSEYARAHDTYHTNSQDVNLIHWSPDLVTIFYNEATGRQDYAIEVSQMLANSIKIGRKDVVSTTPEIFLEAVKMGSMLVVDRQQMFHMRRPNMSGSMQRGWGIPMILPVLKDAFYMQLMKKAQEVILTTYILPQIFLYPQPATANADPFAVVSLDDWRAHLQRELARMRMDPAYMGILPFPVGQQIVGEMGKQLLLMQEIRMMAEFIAVGMGFPIDLVFGQGTYAGSSVNMRMLENFFLSNVQGQHKMTQWLAKRVGTHFNIPPPTRVGFKPFKMADDIQRLALQLQLAQLNKISDTTLLSSMDLSVETESKLQMNEAGVRMEALKKTMVAQAEIQGEASLVAAKYQARAQEVLQPYQQMMGSQTQGQEGIPVDGVIDGMHSQMQGLPEPVRRQQLETLRQQNPEAAAALEQKTMLQQQQVDMRAEPEKLPPRRPQS